MKSKETIIFDETQEPIVFSKMLIDLLLTEQKNFAELLALYTFYYYTAKWQKTNQPKCTTTYAAAGMGWSINKVRKTKARLKKLNLIEDLIRKDKHNKITGHYIVLKFIWTRKQAQKAYRQATRTENDSVAKEATPTISHTMASCGANALSTNNTNINALNTSTWRTKFPIKLSRKETIQKRNKKYFPLAKQLSIIIQEIKNITHTTNQIKTWSNELRRLKEENNVSLPRMQITLDWYAKNIGSEYVPIIESGLSFRNKFQSLEAAITRSQTKPKNNTSTTTGYRNKIKKSYNRVDKVIN